MSTPTASLQRRLVWRLIPTLIFAISMGGVVSYLIAKRAAGYAYDQALTAAAVDIASGIHVDEAAPGFELAPQSERILRSDERDDIFFSVRTASGLVIGGDRDLDATAAVELANATSDDLGFRDRTLRAMTVRVVRNEATFLVTVAETTRKRQAAAWTIFAQLMLPTILVLVLTCAIVWASVRAGLQPLANLQAALEARSDHDLSSIDPGDAPLELQPLIRALNQLLTRLDKVNRVHQSFVADAAHQLRTPLAGIQTQIELLAPQLPAGSAPIERLRFSAARAVRLGNQLLSLARSEVDVNVLTVTSFDLAALIADAADTWVHRAIEHDVDLGFELAPSPLVGDPYLIRELLENLIDNALRHTPKGGQITVTSMPSDGFVELIVEDSGLGVPVAARDRIFERFFRLTEGNETGSGLGLAIVRESAARHEGTAEVAASRALGGLKAVVRLPTAGPRRTAPPTRPTMITARPFPMKCHVGATIHCEGQL